MSPEGPQTVAEQEPEQKQQRSRFLRWHRRVLTFCLIIFALEIGLFLLIFPWTPKWELNWVPVHSPTFAGLWMSRPFRGAISGLGLLNVYIALAELWKQLSTLFSNK